MLLVCVVARKRVAASELVQTKLQKLVDMRQRTHENICNWCVNHIFTISYVSWLETSCCRHAQDSVSGIKSTSNLNCMMMNLRNQDLHQINLDESMRFTDFGLSACELQSTQWHCLRSWFITLIRTQDDMNHMIDDSIQLRCSRACWQGHMSTCFCSFVCTSSQAATRLQATTQTSNIQTYRHLFMNCCSLSTTLSWS